MRRWLTFCIRKFRRPCPLCLLLALLTIFIAVAGLCIGAVSVTPWDIWRILRLGDDGSLAARILLYARLPRVCASLLAGCALAVSGVLIQSVLTNPLASPNIIGVNAGAGFLIVLSCAVFPAAVKFSPLFAFAGAFLGVSMVLIISERAGASRMSLILAGVAISNFFSAGIDALVTFFPDALLGYSDFRIGGLANMTLDRLRPAVCLIAVGLAAALSLANQLDILSLGTETAQGLGLPVRRMRFLFLLIAAALAGAAVSFAGLLGFVGLIVPQIMRRLVGEDSLPLLMSSALGGALLLTLCDLLSRTLFLPYELPVGIVMSFVGGPFFIWLLFRQRGGRIHD